MRDAEVTLGIAVTALPWSMAPLILNGFPG